MAAYLDRDDSGERSLKLSKSSRLQSLRGPNFLLNIFVFLIVSQVIQLLYVYFLYLYQKGGIQNDSEREICAKQGYGTSNGKEFEICIVQFVLLTSIFFSAGE